MTFDYKGDHCNQAKKVLKVVRLMNPKKRKGVLDFIEPYLKNISNAFLGELILQTLGTVEKEQAEEAMSYISTLLKVEEEYVRIYACYLAEIHLEDRLNILSLLASLKGKVQSERTFLKMIVFFNELRDVVTENNNKYLNNETIVQFLEYLGENHLILTGISSDGRLDPNSGFWYWKKRLMKAFYLYSKEIEDQDLEVAGEELDNFYS